MDRVAANVHRLKKMLFLRIIFFIILAIIALKLFFFAVGIFTLVAWAVTGLLIIGAIGWLCYVVFFKSASKAVPETKAGPQLYNHTGNVILFSEKPDLLQITKANDTTSGTIKLPNGQSIKIVEESENVLKVKVTSGEKKGEVAWVSKSDVTGYKP